MKTKVINLYGGPGTGKSTTAGALFAEMKFRGINCEYVQEYAKDKAWEFGTNHLGIPKVFQAQEYIFGKQHFRLRRCAQDVDSENGLTNAKNCGKIELRTVCVRNIKTDAIQLASYLKRNNMSKEAFAAQKPVTKDRVMRCRPGTVLTVKWLDAPNQRGILLEKPQRERGDVSLRILWDDGDINSHAVHDQVVAIHGNAFEIIADRV